MSNSKKQVVEFIVENRLRRHRLNDMNTEQIIELAEAEYETMSFRERLDAFLEWNGIINYTEQIIAAFKELKQQQQQK